MRLYASRVSAISEEVVDALITKELIEVSRESAPEVVLDAESVLKEYLRSDRALTEEAKDAAQERGLDYGGHQKIKRKLAKQRGFGLYEDAVGYICNQLIETFLHTQHVEEIYGADNDLRAAIAIVVKKHMSAGDELDVEVRKRIKNLNEGTADWEIRYQQTLDRLARTKNLSDE